MKMSYPRELFELESGDPLSVIDYGHISFTRFESNAESELGHVDYFCAVRHAYGRWVPINGGDGDMMFIEEKESKLGNFPVTIADY